MTTLRIEGGRRLSGRVAVEGNKNSALPLLAACLLTDQECVLTQRAAHPRRRGAGRSAGRPRRDGRGRGHVDAAHPLRDGHDRSARSRARRPAARLGAAARPAARAQGIGAARAARRRFPGAPHDLHAPAGARGDGRRRRSTSPATRSTRRSGLTGASFYLDEASVTGTETALLAAAAAQGPHRDPPRGDGAARRRALPVPARDGRRRSKARGRRRFASRRRRGSAGATHRLDGDYIEAGSWGVVAAITGGSIEVTGARVDRHRSRRARRSRRWASSARTTTIASSSSRRR